MQKLSLRDAAQAARGSPKILVYGQSGAGKTTLLGTMPGRGLILSAEAGLLSLAHLQRDDVDVVVVDSIDTLREAYALAADDVDLAWVALDSISEIAEIVLTAARAKTKDPRQAYGELIDEVVKISKAFRDLQNKAVLLICKEAREKDEGTGRFTSSPSAPGAKLAGQLPYFFDEVLRLVVVTDKEGKSSRWLQCQPDATSLAKDRSGCLDDFEPPDLSVICDKIKKGKTA